MVGLDVTHKALFTRAHAERLREAGRAGRFVAELSDFFQAFHERSYGFDGSPIHDAMAVAHVIDPTLLTTRRANVAVETRSDYCDGRTVVDLRGVTGREPNAEVGLDVDADRFLELLVVADSLAAVSLVFACIAPHGDLDEIPQLRTAMEELGRRFDAAAARHGDRRHSAQRPCRGALRRRHRGARGGVGGGPRDRGGSSARADLPILGVSYGGNLIEQAEMPLDWGTEVPLDFMRAEANRRRRTGARPAPGAAPAPRRGDRGAARPRTR